MYIDSEYYSLFIRYYLILCVAVRATTLSVFTTVKCLPSLNKALYIYNMAERTEDEAFSRNLQESLQELEELGFCGLTKNDCNIDFIIRLYNPLFKRE